MYMICISVHILICIFCDTSCFEILDYCKCAYIPPKYLYMIVV